MLSFCLQVCSYIYIKQHARSTQIITDIICLSHIFDCVYYFFHYFLCHFSLTKHGLFLLDFLILFYSVFFKVFKCSKSTRYLETQWDPPFGMSLKQCMFYAPNQNMHTVMPVLPKLFLITDWKFPCSSLEAEIRLKCLFTAAWSSGADWI